MCTVLLPLGENPIAVNKYIISYHNISLKLFYKFLALQNILGAYLDKVMDE